MGFISSQIKLQGKWNPGAMVPGVRAFHSAAQEWRFNCGKSAAMQAVTNQVEKLDGFQLSENEAPLDTLVVQVLTLAKWMDQFTFSFEEDQEGSCLVKVRGNSTGLLPVVVPLAPYLNVLFSWFPFLDWGKVARSMGLVRKFIEKEEGSNVKVTLVTKSFSTSNRA
mmetsp:Transcript_14472/g.25939  ORF Transcript_14472/g.25939 Transcript_14472/m.25939 type:complete len:166 (-) Transcript_14472:106-603(-)